jgi:transcriptional regulator with XRE-family HTH domain
LLISEAARKLKFMSEDICKIYQANAAKRIREFREKNSLSQEHVGGQIGRSAAFISQVERKETSPILADYCKLAEIMGLHPLELLTGLPRNVIELAEQLADMEPRECTRKVKLFRLVNEVTELL